MIGRQRHSNRKPPHPQRGAALLLLLAVVGLLVAAFVTILINDIVRENQRRRITEAALAKAKEALIGFAVDVNLNPMPACTGIPNCVRPGDLPCPDLNDDGVAESSCSNTTGGSQERRLGRLPWKTLGLPDLRDGDGERLWYAVSNRFQNTQRTQCSFPGDGGCLNSETAGTITILDSNGTIIHDGRQSTPEPGSGAIAVIIAPGRPLQRDGASSPQDRSCFGPNCRPVTTHTPPPPPPPNDENPAGICETTNPTDTPKCNPENYLDRVVGGEDNAGFIDGSADGFQNGPVFLANGRQIINDTILAIKHDDLMPLLEKRVAREAMNCLIAYGETDPAKYRYPWAAPVAASGSNNYDDQRNYRFGRLPDSLDQTLLGFLTVDPIESECAPLSGLCMKTSWPGPESACNITTGSWWNNWKDQVFYGVAVGNQPNVKDVESLEVPVAPKPPDSCEPADACMGVNPSNPDNVRLVVVVAGRPLTAASQPPVRDKGNINHYLEGSNRDPFKDLNATSTDSFMLELRPRSDDFNDTVLFR